MPKQLDGKSCQICHAYLFDDDDIVICPECGAPFHRECYSKIGHCALEEFHGTDLQYDKVEKRKAEAEAEKEAKKSTSATCPNCKREVKGEFEFCPYCGNNMNAPSGQAVPPFTPFGFSPFDAYGGIPKTDIIEDGVTVEEAAAYIGPKSARYLPRFIENKKTSWNWAAFLCPPAWFAYRKMYPLTAITFALMIVSFICLVPIYSEMFAFIGNLPETTAPISYAEAFKVLVGAVENAPLPAILLSAASYLISLVTSILSGLFGEKSYRTKVVESVKKIKSENSGEDLKKLLAVKGNVNFWLFMLILLIQINSASIIEIFLSFF